MSFFSITWGVAGDAVSATSSSQGGTNTDTGRKISKKISDFTHSAIACAL
jgi:hypothetical protein